MKKKYLLYSLIIAVCFLYTGSAYMSQFYRLMDLCDGVTVDVITSGWNYLLQAAGIGLFSVGLLKRPEVFGRMRTFQILLASGAVFMAVSQVASSFAAVAVSGYVFNLHIGFYFGFYIALLSKNVPPKRSGVCYGAAYAAASVGTFVFSLIQNGGLMTSRYMLAVYLLLAAVTMLLAGRADDLPSGRTSDLQEDKERAGQRTWALIAAVAVMMVITTFGSGLYYSLPQAENVNWYLIRAFYALGLVLAGAILDRNRAAGSYIVAASLAYPLIASALIGDGVTNTLALGISYICRGFTTVYLITAFSDKAFESGRLHLSGLGLMVSRLTESLLSLLLMFAEIPDTLMLIIPAVFFLPLLLILLKLNDKRPAQTVSRTAPADPLQGLAIFSKKYDLTQRESEILSLMAEGLTDDEIADKCCISRNTVRFHVSNILKKTGAAGRTEAARMLRIEGVL